MLKIIKLNKYEKAFVFKDEVFDRLLNEGSHTIIDLSQSIKVRRNQLSNPVVDLDIKDLKNIERESQLNLSEEIIFVNLTDIEFAIVFVDNKVLEVLPPGSIRAYWKQAGKITVTKFNVTESIKLPQNLLPSLSSLNFLGASYLTLQEVKENENTLCFINGKFEEILKPGLNGFFKHSAQKLSFTTYKKVSQIYEVAGQEILTKDKVSLRMNVTACYFISEPLVAIQKIADPYDFAYKKIQLALREIVGSKFLDELLTNKESLGNELFSILKSELKEYGISLEMLGLKDIILPGDMKEILNKVVEADKLAQANLIKRREETAATRSLLNTAKLMEENSILLRLKELETLEKITEKVEKISVFDGLSGILDNFIKIKPQN